MLWWEGGEAGWGTLFGSGYKPDTRPKYVARPALLHGFAATAAAGAEVARTALKIQDDEGIPTASRAVLGVRDPRANAFLN